MLFASLRILTPPTAEPVALDLLRARQQLGTLLSAGAFGPAQPVVSGNVMTVSYAPTLT